MNKKNNSIFSKTKGNSELVLYHQKFPNISGTIAQTEYVLPVSVSTNTNWTTTRQEGECGQNISDILQVSSVQLENSDKFLLVLNM